MNNTKTIIWLFTQPHSGTHFLRIGLELHPNVQNWVQSGYEHRGMRAIDEFYNYLDGNIMYEQFRGTICNTQLHGNDVEWSRQQLSSVGFEPVRDKITHIPFHTHYIWMWDDNQYARIRDEKRLRIVCPLRDPLQSFLTGLYRRNTGIKECLIQLENYRYIYDLWRDGRCYLFPVDLYNTPPSRRSAALSMLQSVGLTADDSCIRYFDQATPINPIILHKPEFYPGMPKVSQRRQQEIMEAKDALKNGTFHKPDFPFLHFWIEKLRESKLIWLFESAGYEDLCWY